MRELIEKKIRNVAVTVTDAAHRHVQTIRDESAFRLAGEYNCSVREVFEAALTEGICPERYLRNREAISIREQIKLAESQVAVAGLGGLGGHVVTLLARLGVGHLVLVDFDVFDETNMNRQTLCDRNSLRRSKCEQAASTLEGINPGVDITFHKVRLTAANVNAILTGSDIVVDDLDNVPDRFLLEEAAGELGIPLVHGAVAGFEGRLMTIFPGDRGLMNLYPDGAAEEDTAASPEALLGVPGITPSVIGALQAMEVLKILLDRGRVFRKIMLSVDLEAGRMEEFTFEDS